MARLHLGMNMRGKKLDQSKLPRWPLNKTDRNIALHTGIGYSAKEIGKEVGLSCSWVSRRIQNLYRYTLDIGVDGTWELLNSKNLPDRDHKKRPGYIPRNTAKNWIWKCMCGKQSRKPNGHYQASQCAKIHHRTQHNNSRKFRIYVIEELHDKTEKGQDGLVQKPCCQTPRALI